MLSPRALIYKKIEVISMKTNEEILEEVHILKNHKKSTQHIYKFATKLYCELNQMTLHELITEAEDEEEKGIRWKHRKLKTRLLKFRQYLMENYYFNTVNNTLAPILVIYKCFEIDIPPLPRIDKKSFINATPILFADLPDKQIIREAINVSSPRMKAIILFMVSSGCARKETLNLTIDSYINATKKYHDSTDIMEIIGILNNIDDVVPTFNVLRQKTQKYYTTFCSPEAVIAINSYLLTRQDTLTPDSQLFKIHEDYLNRKFIKINNKLGLGKKGTYNRFRSHMLRKFHASALYNDGMSIDKVNDLQGKSKNKTDASYFMTNPDDLKNEYIQHLPAVTMLQEVEKIKIKSPEYIRMEQELQEKTEEVQLMNDRVSALEKVIYSNPELIHVTNQFKK